MSFWRRERSANVVFSGVWREEVRSFLVKEARRAGGGGGVVERMEVRVRMRRRDGVWTLILLGLRLGCVGEEWVELGSFGSGRWRE